MSARQPDLFGTVVRSRATRLDTSPPHRTIVEPFNFAPGPECDPDPTYVPPEWLRIALIDGNPQ